MFKLKYQKILFMILYARVKYCNVLIIDNDIVERCVRVRVG
jgi:hypothetical protein